MLITRRQIYNIAELRDMIRGFDLLFGVKPVVRIEVRGPNGMPSGTVEHTSSELLFFPSVGYRLLSIGNKYLTLEFDGETQNYITLNDTAVTFHAAFYLP